MISGSAGVSAVGSVSSESVGHGRECRRRVRKAELPDGGSVSRMS